MAQIFRFGYVILIYFCTFIAGQHSLMKRIILSLVIMGCIAAPTAHAQLLKKLKDKANSVLEKKTDTDPKETEKPVSGNNNSNNNSGSSTVKAPPNASECTLAVTLDAGEVLMYDETKVYLTDGKTVGWKIVTQKDKKFYLIDNGTRTGPFDEPPLNSISPNAKHSNDLEGSDVTAKKYTKLENGKPTIQFNGKTYGPYFMIMEMVVSEDKKHFFATAIEGTNIAAGGVLVSENAKQKLPGMASKLKVSYNFKYAMCMAMDISNGGNAYFITNTGKKTGPYDMMAAMQMADGWLDENGNIITIPQQSPTELLVNGVSVAKFDIEIDKDKLIMSPDPAKSVVFDDGVVYKGDGTKVKADHVLYPHFVTLNNVINICWFQLYKNPQTNNKEIYVCKKPL